MASDNLPPTRFNRRTLKERVGFENEKSLNDMADAATALEL
jgi:hypothetical protein